MYYFLRDRVLIAHEDGNGVRTPLKIREHLEAENFVQNMNRNHPGKITQCFFSPTEIILNEEQVKSNV